MIAPFQFREGVAVARSPAESDLAGIVDTGKSQQIGSGIEIRDAVDLGPSGILEREQVAAGAADQMVVAASANDPVVAGAAGQEVVSASALQDIRACPPTSRSLPCSPQI